MTNTHDSIRADPLCMIASEYSLGISERLGEGKSVRWWLPTAVDWDNLPEQGFKIHLSATVSSAANLLQVVLPYLIKNKYYFKFIEDFPSLQQLNCGYYSYSQVGKFLTIYPLTDTSALRITQELDEFVSDFEGPAIPSDLPILPNSIVQYRYGAFRLQETIQNSDGQQVHDSRLPHDSVPDWIDDPIREYWEEKNIVCDRDDFFKDYILVGVLSQRPRGGVYVAIQRPTKRSQGQPNKVRAVVAKEGRRHGETELSGTDGYDRVAMEARLYQRLQGCISIPKLIETRISSNSFFLILEHLPGKILKDYLTSGNSFSVEEIRRIVWAIIEEVRRVRSYGVILFDLSPGNIILQTSGCIRLIDFEHALDEENLEDPDWNFGTPGFFPAASLVESLSEHFETRLTRRMVFSLCAIASMLMFPSIYNQLVSQAGDSSDLWEIAQEQIQEGPWLEFFEQGCLLHGQFDSVKALTDALATLPGVPAQMTENAQ